MKRLKRVHLYEDNRFRRGFDSPSRDSLARDFVVNWPYSEAKIGELRTSEGSAC